MVLVNEVDNSCSSEEEGRNINGTQNQHPQNGSNQPAREDIPELIKLLIGSCKELGQKIKQTFHFVLNELQCNQILDCLAQWCVRHPQMAICLLSAGLLVSFPILVFMAFALSTIVMTLTGFLVLEGTLLTIITMIMLGLLGALGVVLLFFAVVGLATYFGVSHAYDMYGRTEAERTILRNAMQENNQN